MSGFRMSIRSNRPTSKQLRFYSHKFSSVIKNCSEAFTRWDNVHTLKLVIRVLQYNNNNNEVESFIEKAFYFLIIQNALPLRLLSRLLSQWATISVHPCITQPTGLKWSDIHQLIQRIFQRIQAPIEFLRNLKTDLNFSTK